MEISAEIKESGKRDVSEEPDVEMGSMFCTGLNLEVDDPIGSIGSGERVAGVDKVE